MTTFDLLAIYQAVCSQLEAALDPVGAAVLKGEVPEGEDVERAPNGQVRPYASVFMGTPGEGQAPGIVGVQYDLSYVDGMVLVVAERYTDCLALVGLIHRTLNGFVAGDGCGQTVCFGSAQRNPVPDLMHPARYAQTLGFGMSIGANSVVP